MRTVAAVTLAAMLAATPALAQAQSAPPNLQPPPPVEKSSWSPLGYAVMALAGGVAFYYLVPASVLAATGQALASGVSYVTGGLITMEAAPVAAAAGAAVAHH